MAPTERGTLAEAPGTRLRASFSSSDTEGALRPAFLFSLGIRERTCECSLSPSHGGLLNHIKELALALSGEQTNDHSHLCVT